MMAPVPDRAAVGVLGADGTEAVEADDEGVDGATGIAGAVTARAADVPLVPLPATLVPVTVQVYAPAVSGAWVDAAAPGTVAPLRCHA